MESRSWRAIFDQFAGISIFDFLVSNSARCSESRSNSTCSAGFLGNDRVGALYTNLSITHAADLKKHVKKGMKQGNNNYKTKDFQRSYSLALRAAFMVQT
jgi:hypothetical protein